MVSVPLSELPAWLKGVVPEKIQARVLDRLRGILSKLLRREIKKPECVSEAYQVFTDELKQFGDPLSDETLEKTIPSWVFCLAG